ncbi:MAG: MotA/TolQ/ExbB proton channel family protein [Planctomycetes bacterium]|nr:MotA/TolQ/ExbB proton channel family protein [Planctomycetota bacterium]
MSNGKSPGLSSASRRPALANLAAFVFGLPLGVAVLAIILYGPFEDTELRRYVEHPVEHAEVVLFCCGLGLLVGKLLAQAKERAAFRSINVPAWDGQPAPVQEAETLANELWQSGRVARNSLVWRRVLGLLDFVRGRNSAHGLDDQMRALSDNDAIALDSSFAMVRLITWAIPMLGFLGTVLGITQAIVGVTPEVLEKSLSTVTDGLSKAFDTTALALGLTMILMFLNYLVDRFEQRTLASVDAFVDDRLAHRFERTGPDADGASHAFRQNLQLMVKATEQLVEKQAAIWARSLQSAEKHWNEGAQREGEKLRAVMESAIERTLASHSQRLAEVEKQAVERSRALYEGLTALATVLRDTGREHQAAMAQVAERLAAQGDMLARLHEDDSQLTRLQDTLQRNLAALASAGTFEQAVESLTAAIHLLSARTGGSQAMGPRPGKAA